jgi:hypothetical protein
LVDREKVVVNEQLENELLVVEEATERNGRGR